MKKFLKYSFVTLAVIMIITTLLFVVYFTTTTRDIRLDIARLERAKTITLLDNEDNAIINDNYIPYGEIPSMLVKAFVSIEDKAFFQHNGINMKRIGGALLYNTTHGKRAQGASTITQQLIKNTHLSNAKAYDRKLKEIKLALKLEKVLTKEQIMEKYLNSLYFGDGIYGISNACKEIFAKELKDLTIGEMATLAGIIKAPRYYSPLKDIQNSQSRRDIVLNEMYKDKYITKEEYVEAKNSELIINNDVIHSNIHVSYTKNVLKEASSILGIPVQELASSNYKIGTYYDRNSQYKVVNSVLSYSDYINDNSALAVLGDNATNGIKAIYMSGENDIYALRRQIGSIIKPLAVYLPALEYGLIRPATIRNDSMITNLDYSPHNYGDIYRGNISMRCALAHSSNVIAVKLLNELGIDKSIAMLSNLGIHTDNKGLSLALGSSDTGYSLLEILNAYQCLANGGIQSNSTFIRYIVDENGNVVYRHSPARNIVASDSSCYLLTDMLQDVVNNGTAKKLNSLPFDIAAKTGTVANPNDGSKNIDAYSASYTSKDTMLIWLGGDLAHNIQGGGIPTLIARDIYSQIYEKDAPEPFIAPNSIERLTFDRDKYLENGDIILSNGENTIEDIFDKRYLPTNKLPEEDKISIDYIDSTLHIQGANGTTIKIYKKNIFAKETIYREILCNTDSMQITLEPLVFGGYSVEIYDGEKLIKNKNNIH